MNKIWTISRETSELAVIRENIESILSELKMDPIYKSRMILCIDEAAANIIEHTPITGKHVEGFTIETTIDNSSVTVTIIDNGSKYDPTKEKDVDIKKHIRSGKKGGLGIFIMKSQLDIFEYKYENQCNVLTLGMNLKQDKLN